MFQTKYQQGYCGIEQYLSSNVFNRYKYIYSILHPKQVKYTFFSNSHGTFLKIDHIIGSKKASSNSRKLKSYQAFFSDHKGLKLETNFKGKTQNTQFHGY